MLSSFGGHKNSGTIKFDANDPSLQFDANDTDMLPEHYKPHEPVYRYKQPFIRGVNIGGYFVLERFITPYQFAVTDCHIRGEFCWYPDQASAPPTDHPDYKLCDPNTCKAYQVPQASLDGDLDYPVDEYTLAEAFGNSMEGKGRAAQWLQYHLDNFISKEDIKTLAQAGITHVRVPIPHWILGEAYVLDSEPWIPGNRWEALTRLVRWCRDVGLQLWPDIHTAPGSQNGFDNSGQQQKNSPCYWSQNETSVNRSLNVIDAITRAFVENNMTDVITGLGLLNEPFKSCSNHVYFQFCEDGLSIVRRNMGNEFAVFISDKFQPELFSDRQNRKWWRDPVKYNNTYLDSHYYQVFPERGRALSPRQHILVACANQYRDVVGCCYDDGEPSRGIRRLMGEWSGAYDQLPASVVNAIMTNIAETGKALWLDRQLSEARTNFLRHYVEAQMVVFEAAEVGTSAGWFYWTIKMEGGAFAEWDFLRGLSEGWIPHVPSPEIASQQVHGSCYDIAFRSNDDYSIIDEYPDPDHLPQGIWMGPDYNDDIIVSHGQSLLPQGPFGMGYKFMVITGALLAAVAFVRSWYNRRASKWQYAELGDVPDPRINLTL